MYVYKCNLCENIFERTFIKKSKSGLTFCSKKCSGEYKKTSREPFQQTCKYCGNVKEVDTNWKSKNRKFCSNKCRYGYMKQNPTEFITQKFKEAGLKASNSLQAIEKGLLTKFNNGTLTNWENIQTWKKYYKECNRLTRLIRKQLLLEWDGYDSIDGEYIRDYLSFPHYHKLYPTLDHIVPRSECFRRGLTPKQATTPENLQWTKRSNNSSKGCKFQK